MGPLHSSDLPRFEITGPPHGPVVIAAGGISANAHVTATEADPSAGWWEGVVGPCRAIDTTYFRAVAIDFLDGGRGTDGRPERTVTTHDQAHAIARVLDRLAVQRAAAFVGASYGGMVGLAFAERYPERLDRLVAISAPHEPHPMATALRALQRRIVCLGLDTGEVTDALAIARGLAMTTYRSAREFGARFATAPVEAWANDAIFPVDGYLRHHGERFAARWAPERFLALSLSTDLHRVNPAAITTPTTVVAAEGDAIVFREQLDALAASLAGPVHLAELATTTGHDAFLTEPERLGAILEFALSTRTLS